jgi:hypothetical protein
VTFLTIAVFLLLAGPGVASAQDPGRQNGTRPAEETQVDPPGLWPEPRRIGEGIAFVARRIGESDGMPRDGFYPEFGHMITGAGWISLGPGYRHQLLNRQALVDTSAALSWRGYKMAQARAELPYLAGNRLALASQVTWQDLTQVNYFGPGIDSPLSQRTNYRLRYTDVMAYATGRANRWLSVGGRLGLLHHATVSPAAGWHIAHPDTQQLLGEDLAPGLTLQPSFVHADVSLTADTRDHSGHPIRGGFYRVAWESFFGPDAGKYSFQRYELEVGQFIPVVRGAGLLALRAWAVFSDPAHGHVVPFYMLPSLGGQNTLRGYRDYRFHDRDLLAFSAESRWALTTHVDGAVFLDAGTVAPRVVDFRLSPLKTSYGVGVRVHTRTTTLGRFDVGHSREGWRFLFKLNDPLELKRSSRRSIVAPFVP